MPQLLGIRLQAAHRRIVGGDGQFHFSVTAGRLDQLHGRADHFLNSAVDAFELLRLSGGEKPLQMLFSQRQLPQRDIEAFVVTLAT